MKEKGKMKERCNMAYRVFMINSPGELLFELTPTFFLGGVSKRGSYSGGWVIFNVIASFPRKWNPDQTVAKLSQLGQRTRLMRWAPKGDNRLHSHNLWSDRFLCVNPDGEGTMSKFKQEDGQTDGWKTTRATDRDKIGATSQSRKVTRPIPDVQYQPESLCGWPAVVIPIRSV